MSSSERDDPRRFHTIERTNFAPFGVTSVRGNSEEKTPYRSRSMSRSPHYAEAKRDLKTADISARQTTFQVAEQSIEKRESTKGAM